MFGIWRKCGATQPLLWSRPVWIQASKTKSQVGIILIDVRKNYKLESYWLMPICSPPNFSCAWLAVNFNRNLSEFNDCVLRTGNSQAKILFENKDSQAKGRKGETTVLQNFAHPSQQKFFELLGTRELQIVLCSLFHIFTHTPVGIPTVYVQLEFQLCPYCNVGLEPRPIFFRYPILLCHIRHISF